MDIIASIRAEALRLGFSSIGFTEARLPPEARARLDAFLAAGMQGEMGWLADRAAQRAQPQALWPDAVSVISLGLNYGPEEDPLAVLAQRERGSISVYARNRDYHELVKSRLKALARWMLARRAGQLKVFVDTAPVLEKPLAQQAGPRLAGQAHQPGQPRTRLLAVPRRDLHHPGAAARRARDRPLRLLPRLPRQLPDRRLPGALPAGCPALHQLPDHRAPRADPRGAPGAMGNRIYGCDDCLAVCPWNKFAAAHSEPAFAPRASLDAPRLAELAALDDAGFRALFTASPVKRIGRDRFVRNVLVAIGNSASPALRATAQALAEDPDPVVADAARWAAGRLETA